MEKLRCSIFKPLQSAIKENQFWIWIIGTVFLHFVPDTKHQLPALHYLTATIRMPQQGTYTIPQISTQ
jgi:hypothetical protein